VLEGYRVGDLLAEARRRLAGASVDAAAAALEAELLMGHVLGRNRAWLFANGRELLGEETVAGFRALVGQRAGGTPVAYLLGRREFWSMPLFVTADVLIPRPETELLVQTALDFIPAAAAWRIADLGTGSGAVALALARERPNCEVHATDISPAALAVAARNVEAFAPGRVLLHEGSWLLPLKGRFRVIVSNPPYVAEGDPHLQQGDCRFEPAAALSPGPDGLAALRRIARDALPFLKPGGLLALEHGFDQGSAVRSVLEGLGYERVRTQKDLAGVERVTGGIS
jgi:release factor glutamine methyltransferase